MKLLCGVDLTSISRIDRMFTEAGPSFREVTWTPAELAFCDGRPDKLATRWAAKEAAMKALGIGVDTVRPREIEVLQAPGERPTLRLSEMALVIGEAKRVRHWAVSMAREGDMAIAIVNGVCA